MTSEYFYENFVRTGTPVIIKDGFDVAGWREPEEWTDDLLRAIIGQAQVLVSISEDNIFYTGGVEEGIMEVLTP